jgi:hypothetical protein
MAWKRTDDLDGSAAEQCLFGLGGIMYTIDLSPRNRDVLAAALAPFIAVATVYGTMPDPSALSLAPEPAAEPAPKPARRAGGRGKASTAVPQATMRQWATDNGFEVSARGRIPDAIAAHYAAAMAGR